MIFLGISSVYAQTPTEYLQNGNDSLKAGDFNQAVYEYTKAIDINPNLAKAFDNRGVAFAKQGYLAPAISDFTMAIAIDPKDSEAYNNRGHAYAVQGDLTQAIRDYSKAIKINPVYLKAYNNRAQVFYSQKEFDKAWADVFKVERLGGAIDHDFYQELKKASKPIIHNKTFIN